MKPSNKLAPPVKYHESGAPVNSIDEIIELYKRDVDVTLIDESLRRTVEERLRALEEFEAFREELRIGTASRPSQTGK